MLPAVTALFSTGLLAGSYLPYFPLLTTVLLIVLALLISVKERRSGSAAQTGHGYYAALLAGLLYWHVFFFFFFFTPAISGLRTDFTTTPGSKFCQAKMAGISR